MLLYLIGIKSDFKKNNNNFGSFFKKTKRNYEATQKKIVSRKIYFYPEFFTSGKKDLYFLKKKKINFIKFKKKQKYLIQILGIFYGIIIMNRVLVSQVTYFSFISSFVQKITFFERSFFFILLFSLLFSQKAYFSKSIEQTLIAAGIYVFFFEIENNFFFFSHNIENLSLIVFSHIFIVLAFWSQKNPNKKLKKNFSNVSASFTEIKILLTTHSVIKIFFQGIFNILLVEQRKILFPFFLTNWAACVSTTNLLEFSRNTFFLKSGLVLFFLFLTLFFLYYQAFLTKTIKKNLLFPLFRLNFIFQLAFIFKKKKLKNMTAKSFFLIKTDGLIENVNDLFLEDYSSKNFSFFEDKSRWKITRKGINVPFSDSFWNNESSFPKKKLSWKIKANKNQ
ncbi:hypothetical protein CMESO_261 (nucleomorph) [Chroomonas mesostigmatica CCMP1168]|uniref:Uncharacterized protein n=1 Tax=Chroomonas mesostigmatica CCMP1168 TaxID=1195612 RepID=J7G812_9CRYP|nr:hypothetical protein CMESO_261 [Chroomonas mesostigmatica CCMP1168]